MGTRDRDPPRRRPVFPRPSARKRNPVLVLLVALGVAGTVGAVLLTRTATEARPPGDLASLAKSAQAHVGEGTTEPGSDSPFVAPPEGHWDAYALSHASEGVADAVGGTSVESRLETEGYLLRLRQAQIFVPARLWARVVAKSTETLLETGTPTAREAGEGGAWGTGGAVNAATRGAAADVPAFEPSLVRLALAGDGLLYFPGAGVPGLSMEGVKYLRRDPGTSPVVGGGESRPARGTRGRTDPVGGARGHSQGDADGSGALVDQGPLLGNLLTDAARILTARAPGAPPTPGTLARGGAFELSEFDDDAPAPTRYRVLSREGNAFVLSREVGARRSARTTAPTTARDTGLATTVDDSREIALEASPYSLTSATGTRSQALVRGQAPLARNVFRWNLRRRATGRLGAAQLLEVDLLLREALGARVPPGRTPNLVRQMHKETLGDDSLASLLVRLDDLRGAPSVGEAEKTRLYLKIKALLVLQPDLALAVAERARGTSAGSLELQLLAGALSSAGTPEAQAALMELVRSTPKGARKRLELVPLLGMAENPTASTLLFLEGLSREPAGAESTAALLSLGIAAHKARDAEGALASRIASSLRERLLSARDDGEIIRTLASGGNTEDESFLRAAAGFLSHASESVRAQAIFALRMAPFERFEREYGRALRDPSERVRQRALDALGQQQRSPRIASSLMEAFPEQKSTRLRLGLLRKIWSNGVEGRGSDAQARPEVKEFVEGVAQDASLPDVRPLAMELLGSKAP